MNVRHCFFDVDKTLTPSRSLMLETHQLLFSRLCEAKDVIAVSGAEEAQIRKQIPRGFDGRYYILAQNGNHALNKDGAVLWKEELTDAQRQAIQAFIEKVKAELALQVKDENDLIEDRGSQISYSLIGHHEDTDKKYAFDADAAKRLEILKMHGDDVRALKEHDVEVKTGGTTTLDFFPWGKHKGFNVGRLLEKFYWKKEECIYVGDALFPGGNDETVIGVIPTHAVKDHNETFTFIEIEILR